MNFNILRNLVAFKALSFIGYLNIIFNLIFYFIIRPNHLTYLKHYNIYQEDDYFLDLIFSFYYCISVLLLLFFIIFAIFEYFAKKDNPFNSLKETKYSKFNNILFWLGIIFSALPIYYFLVIFIIMSFYINN